MKIAKSILLVGLLFTATFGTFTVKANCADEIWIMKPFYKLGRGIANAGLCPLEIPMKWHDVTYVYGGVTGITYGTLKGVCFTVARACVGVADVATFFMPLPGCPDDPSGYGWGYGPIMQPEWVIDAEHDWWNFTFDRETAAPHNNY